MYLVGGGTHPGSGLPVIFESARITSRLLVGGPGYALHVSDAVQGELEGRFPRRSAVSSARK